MAVLSVQSATSTESSSDTLDFTVELSTTEIEPVTVSYQLYAGTAESADTFYGFNSSQNIGTLTFAPGEQIKTVSIFARSDSEDERDESVVIEFYNLSENAEFTNGETTLNATGVIFDNDGAGLNQDVFVSSPTILEADGGGKVAEFEVRLSQPASGTTRIDYATKDISAEAGSDYIPTSGTLTFESGDEVKTVSVNLLGDTEFEPREYFALVAAPQVPGAFGTEGLVGEATIEDNDTAPVPVVSLASAETVESSSRSLSYRVTLTEPALDVVSFSYRLVADTADETDTFYNFSSSQNTGTITFAPGQTTKVIHVFTRTDSVDERDETVTLQLYNLTENASFSSGEDTLTATGVILDDDGASTNRMLTVSSPSLVEGDGGSKFVDFEIRLTQPAATAFTVTYATQDISAVADEDYVAASGSITFAPGEELQVVRVEVLGDSVTEATEQFSLIVDVPNTVSLGQDGLVGEATIRDDDAAPNPVVSASPARTVESSSYALAYEISLSEAANDTVSMAYRLFPGTGESVDLFYGVDSSQNIGTVTFAPGETTKIISVFTRTDSDDERDESIILELSNLTANASFAGGSDLLRATGIVEDNDGVGVNQALLVSDPILVETDTGTVFADFEIRLTQPSTSAFTVNYATKDVTATAGEDYVAQIGQLSFAVGEQLKSVRVEVMGDDVEELTEQFSLVLTPPNGVSVGTAGLAGVATIRDDDGDTTPVISVSTAEAVEGSSTALNYRLTLSEASVNPVTVEYSIDGGTGTTDDVFYGFSSNQNTGTVTFAPGETAATITVFARTDSDDERDETILLELLNPTGAIFADGAPSVESVGFILDNDGVGPNTALTVAPTILRERGVDSFTYAVPLLLSRPATDTLTFDIAAQDQSAELGSDYLILDSFVTFEPGETHASVAIEVLGDGELEGTETFAIAVTARAGTPFTGTIPTQSISIINGPNVPTDANDTLDGTAGADTINLRGGEDRFNGLEGDDIIRGGAGDDTLIGGEGDDQLFGEAGDDLLIGGEVTLSVDTNGAQVYRLYQATLARAPDSGGLQGWVDELEAGTDLLDIIAGFVGSQEFQNVYGTLDDAGFITQLYQNVLGRDPDAGGLAGWLAVLNDGEPRAVVVRGLSESLEFRNQTGEAATMYETARIARDTTAFVDDTYRLYQATLGREPDSTGIQFWAEQLGAGQSYQEVAVGFTNSAEFRNTYGTLDDAGFIELLYVNVLGRGSDEGGRNGWLQAMEDGLSREGVVQGFAQSLEFVNGTAADFAAYMAARGGDTYVGGPGSDTLSGGFDADTFVFDAGDDGGRSTVLQVDAWDTLSFTGFGYAATGDATANMIQFGNDVLFNDEGVQVVFAGMTVAEMENVLYSFG